MNIILLISDTFRYDNLFDRAAMPVNTPELDRFHQRAVSLSRMYTSSFPTIPHRTDLTTGRFGWPWYPWQAIDQSSANHIPKLLGRAGYVSQLLCDCPHLFKARFNEAFTGAWHFRGQEGDKPFLRMNHPIESVMAPEKTRSGKGLMGHPIVDIARWTNQRWYREIDRFCAQTALMASEWLEENYQHKPFFLWVDFFDPHEPWDPPEYMVKRYDPDYDGAPMLHPNYGKASDLTRAELKNLRAHYCAEAELADRWVGRVLQKIDDLRLWDNSIVVFTTDHGMSLGEHNRTGKTNINERDNRSWPIYPEVAHIPLLIAAPGIKGGRAIDAILQPPDILPTLFELAGLDIKPPEPFHGKSFAGLLRGKSKKALREFAISAGHPKLNAPDKKYKGGAPVLYTNEWAYAPIGVREQRELFNLKRDPGCDHNVAKTHPKIVKDLHARFIGWLRKMNAPQEMIAFFE